jgi:DNA-binding transcriptional ArsR family regulator
MESSALARLEANASDIARTLKLFANEQRIHILCRLLEAGHELPVATIAADLKIGQSALSQHLAKLRSSGVVAARRVGHNLLYRILDPKAAALTIGLRRVVQALKDESEASCARFVRNQIRIRNGKGASLTAKRMP